jgi:uracil-DNA glycosylase family 4
LDQFLSAQKNKNVEPDSTLDRMVDPASLALLTRQVRNLLAFHAQLGLSSYPAMPELRNILLRAPTSLKPAAALSGQQNRQQYAGPVPDTAQAVRKIAVPSEGLSKEATAGQLQTITQEIAACQRCFSDAGKSARRTSSLSGVGSAKPRLLVLGDCYIGDPPQDSNITKEGMIWGRKEDELFWKMMAAIGLDQKTVYVTNTVKCPQKDPVPPGTEREHPCFLFLEKELLAIRPQLICTMGDTATRALLRSKAPLVRLRGRFHPYNYPGGGRAKVMPTFHPRFLLQLQDPEMEKMKRATWEDLQALQRLLPELQE